MIFDLPTKEGISVMTVQFKPDETFRGNYNFKNSDEAILSFPFPFPEDEYMYSMNAEPHVRSGQSPSYHHAFDIDEHYIAECRERAIILEQDPNRCQVMPHLQIAEWDTLELLMDSLSTDYPQWFSLTKAADKWCWVNRLLTIEQNFIFGDASTLPLPPFEYITRQVQGDFTLQDQRDNNLFIEGGMVTSQADWSLNFDKGMSFHEWHAPVPLAHDMGVFDRALKFLLKLQYGQPVRRLNWTLTVNPRLDTSPENYAVWGPDRMTVTPENVRQKVHLRVELQSLFRLPRSNAILFSIRGYLASIEEIQRVPKWRRRLHRVIRDLNPSIRTYKGFSRYYDTLVSALAAGDDGLPTSSGIQPDIDRLS
ncbi:putative cytosolic protein [Granulibacter bethesdensis]|nr:putative cytosolic protein [Granulibacter bethesdensis]